MTAYMYLCTLHFTSYTTFIHYTHFSIEIATVPTLAMWYIIEEWSGKDICPQMFINKLKT